MKPWHIIVAGIAVIFGVYCFVRNRSTVAPPIAPNAGGGVKADNPPPYNMAPASNPVIGVWTSFGNTGGAVGRGDTFRETDAVKTPFGEPATSTPTIGRHPR